MAIALDGTASGITFFGTSQATGTLTTANGSGLIVVAIYTSTSQIPTVPTATGITFTLRSQITSGSTTISTYTAPYSTNFSGAVSSTTGSNCILQICAFGVSGVNAFDSNGSVPNTVASGDPTVTTSNANSFLFSAEATTGAPTAGGLFTEVIPFTFTTFMVEYQIVSATGTYTATLGSGGPAIGSAMDALVSASLDVLQSQIWM